MPSDSRRSEFASRPTAWVFRAPGAGDNGQLAALVELANLDARWVERVDSVPRVIADRLLGAVARQVPRDKRDELRPPWPDIVLIAGGRSVVDALRVRRASGGRTRIVCVGRPWAPLAWFDLVITTPQYRLPPVDNLLMLDLPLNRPVPVDDDERECWRREFELLPRPWLGVVLGGDSGSYRFKRRIAVELGKVLNGLLGPIGGSVIVAGSPRTPAEATEALESELTVPAQIHRFGAGDNPYGAVLELADALIVTSDSASMLAEACFSGIPVAVYDLAERPRVRAVRNLRRATPWLQPLLRFLSARGLWVPARDLPKLHERLATRGWVCSLDELLRTGSTHRSGIEEFLGPVRIRIAALLADRKDLNTGSPNCDETD